MPARKTGLSRREFLAGAAVAAAGTILAACTPTPTTTPTVKPTTAGAATNAPQATHPPAATPAPAKKGAGTVTYWTGWGPIHKRGVDTIVASEQFKQAFADIDFQPTFTVKPEAVLAAVAAGAPPDCICQAGDPIGYKSTGVCLPLDDLVAQSSVIKKDMYFPQAWQCCQWQGKLLGVPAFEGYLRWHTYYNSKLVSEAGLDPNKPPHTWDELTAWHKALTKFDNAGNLVQVGLDPYDYIAGNFDVGNGFFPAGSWGVKWYDEQTGKFDLANDKMAESFEVMGEFVKYCDPDKLAGFHQVPGQGGSLAFMAGVEAMTIGLYAVPGQLVTSNSPVAPYCKVCHPPVPASRANVKLLGAAGWYMLLFKDGKNHEGAFRWTEFVNTKFGLDTIWQQCGWLPPIQSFIDTVDPSPYPSMAETFKLTKEATEVAPTAQCPVTAVASQNWKQLREAVFRGQKTGKQAAQELQTVCENELKKLRS